MIPATISTPARKAQEAKSSEEAKRYQLEALAAAWRWGLEDFQRKHPNRWLDRKEVSRRWINLAGEEPYCGCRGEGQADGDRGDADAMPRKASSSLGCCGEGFIRILV
jgi:hypothetical protein